MSRARPPQASSSKRSSRSWVSAETRLSSRSTSPPWADWQREPSSLRPRAPRNKRPATRRAKAGREFGCSCPLIYPARIRAARNRRCDRARGIRGGMAARFRARSRRGLEPVLERGLNSASKRNCRCERWWATGEREPRTEWTSRRFRAWFPAIRRAGRSRRDAVRSSEPDAHPHQNEQQREPQHDTEHALRSVEIPGSVVTHRRGVAPLRLGIFVHGGLASLRRPLT